jgi:predicted acyl esterase
VSAPAAEVRLRDGISPVAAGVPEPRHAVTAADGMRIERNVTIPLRDGVEIYADLYLPETAGTTVPALIAYGPYGKHNGGNVYAQFRDESGTAGGGVRPEWISPYTTFEGPDPRRWCSFGYAVLNVDPRARWWSGGEVASMWNALEARDCADVIEWAGAQPWSTGKVGMSGVSWLAVTQWWAASLRPPCLAAINPCEGLSDVYREFAFHGGIASNFPAFLQEHRLQHSLSRVEALSDMMADHPLDDAYWASKRPELAAIDVPAYVIASWSDQGLHTRGTLAAFEQIGSEHKFLEVHGRKKWETYHSPSAVERQRRFFDRFLKDLPNEVDDWPRVRLEVRRAFYDGVERRPGAGPAPQASVRRLHLDAEGGTLTEEPPDAAAVVGYRADDPDDGVTFRHVFAEAVDVVGSARLRLWVAAEEAGDLDLFVALTKRDRDGRTVEFPYANVLEHGPLALGWLRASHRALDQERSTATRPFHPHAREEPLAHGEVVAVDVEIWPSGTRFEAGEEIELRVQGSDPYPGAALWRHPVTRNRGTHTIHAGGARDSHLALSVLAPEPDAAVWPSPDV